MVSTLILALLAGLNVLPALPQQRNKPPNPAAWNRQFPPKKIVIAPGNRFVMPRSSTGRCSIPLTNALAGARPNELRMPTISPRNVGKMPEVHVPAPPCTDWPGK